VYSADLKKATDGLSHQWLSWICHYLGLPASEVFITEYIDAGGSIVELLRGAFMGLPVSWTLLTLTHLIICERVDPDGYFWLKGDDMIAYWTRAQWDKYKQLMTVTGMTINESKSFVAERRGTFCEGLYQLSNDGLELIPTMSLRGFVHKTNTGSVFDNVSMAMKDSILRGVNRHHVWNVLRATSGDILGLCERSRTPLALPRQLGGLGFPCENPGALVGKVKQSIAWGNLDKGVSIDPTAYMPSGPVAKRFAKRLEDLKYRSGVQLDCVHLNSLVGKVKARIALFESETDPNYVRTGPFLKALSRRRKKTSQIRLERADAHQLTWGGLQSVYNSLRPTPDSLQEVFYHFCGSKPLKAWRW
jgi:hypothetical protein